MSSSLAPPSSSARDERRYDSALEGILRLSLPQLQVIPNALVRPPINEGHPVVHAHPRKAPGWVEGDRAAGPPKTEGARAEFFQPAFIGHCGFGVGAHATLNSYKPNVSDNSSLPLTQGTFRTLPGSFHGGDGRLLLRIVPVLCRARSPVSAVALATPSSGRA